MGEIKNLGLTYPSKLSWCITKFSELNSNQCMTIRNDDDDDDDDGNSLYYMLGQFAFQYWERQD